MRRRGRERNEARNRGSFEVRREKLEDCKMACMADKEESFTQRLSL